MTAKVKNQSWVFSQVKTAETRDVRQFHFTAWPDHGVPETTEVLINFRHLVREHMDNFSRNAPAVVHCRFAPHSSIPFMECFRKEILIVIGAYVKASHLLTKLSN